MRTRSSALGLIVLIPALSLNLIPTCGGGGGGGSKGKTSSITILEDEPNDTSDERHVVFPGIPVRGDLLRLGDVDWFGVPVAPGLSLKVELFGTRRDQSTWDAAATIPRLTLYFPSPDLPILEHSFTTGWTSGNLDFEIPSFHLFDIGGFYWIKIQPENDQVAGGEYVVRASYSNLGPNQMEVEASGDTGGNDSSGTAQRIAPGILSGFHRDGNEDFYSLAVGGPSVLRFEIIGGRDGTYAGALLPYDPALRLFDVDGTTLLAQNDDAFLTDPAIQFEVPSAGVYTIDVTQSLTSTVGGPYRLLASVSPATSVPEVEPNDDPTTATSAVYGQNLSGAIAPGEDDWFRFTGTAGDMVRLQVFDANNSLSASEAVTVTLVDSDGVTPLGSHEGPLFQVLTTILQQNGPTYVHVQPDPAAVGPTTYRLELRRFHASVYETEPNDTLAQAPVFPNSGFVSGAIGTIGDVDTYKFAAAPHQLVVFDVYASDVPTGTDQQKEYSGHGSALAPLLTVRDVNGVAVATSTSLPVNAVYTESVSDGLPTAAIAFVAPTTSHIFYLEVAAADGTGGADHTYVVQRR